MIRVEKIDVWGFEHATRAMRNPLDSWDKSDSGYLVPFSDEFEVGENDLDLMRRLYKAGSEHRKYARQIMVSMDIVAPLYWWKEFDTYKVGTTANSCSTMHTLTKRPITLADFSIDDYELLGVYKDVFKATIDGCETLRKTYLASGDRQYWRALIQLLPESFNQRRTVTFNYENVFNIIRQRSGHKLSEWHEFCDVLRELPYVKEIINENSAE